MYDFSRARRGSPAAPPRADGGRRDTGRRAHAEARYAVIDALQASQRPITDREIAAATAGDLARVRTALRVLAEGRMVELTPQDPDCVSVRLVAL